MKVLSYIAALNDGELLDQCIQGLLAQTHPVNEILVVDNGSTDGTPYKTLPEGVTLICHTENRGTSGAVVTGLKYALARDYDWMWVFDADSVPRKDGLEQLIKLYKSFPREIQNQIRVLGSLPVDAGTREPHHGIILAPKGFTKGFTEVKPDPNATFYECDSTMWSGSLFNLKVVRQMGLPREDYFLDFGDHEYGYRGKKAGYKTFMSQLSIIDHNLHPMPTVRHVRLGPLSFTVGTSPPMRRYYLFRNFLYFWFYEYDEDSSSMLLPYVYLLKLTVQMVKIGIYHKNPLPELSACLRGMWDGLRKNLHHRY